jgi:hypothetical protein
VVGMLLSLNYNRSWMLLFYVGYGLVLKQFVESVNDSCRWVIS